MFYFLFKNWEVVMNNFTKLFLLAGMIFTLSAQDAFSADGNNRENPIDVDAFAATEAARIEALYQVVINQVKQDRMQKRQNIVCALAIVVIGGAFVYFNPAALQDGVGSLSSSFLDLVNNTLS
jgi:hypothetical protein